MKLFFIAPGNSIHSFKWIKYFSKLDYEIHWISFDEFDLKFNSDKIHYYNLKKFNNSIITILFSLIRIKKILKQIKPNILHAHSAGKYGFIASLLNFKPFILSPWGSDVLVNKNHFLKKIFLKFTLKKADLITVDAFHMQDQIIKLGIKKNIIEIIMFGIETDIFKPSGQKNSIKKTLGFDMNDKLIISLRNFSIIYDIKTFILAAKNITSKNSNVKFILVGSGPEELTLKNLVKDLKLKNNIIFTGRLSQIELKSYLLIADIYVSTALSDAGISGSTAEAMSCGLTPVISNTGENDRWVEEGKNGFLFPAGSVETLSKKLLLLLDDEKKLKFLSKNTREIILKNNNYIVEMDKMNQHYKKLNKTKYIKD